MLVAVDVVIGNKQWWNYKSLWQSKDSTSIEYFIVWTSEIFMVIS